MLQDFLNTLQAKVDNFAFISLESFIDIKWIPNPPSMDFVLSFFDFDFIVWVDSTAFTNGWCHWPSFCAWFYEIITSYYHAILAVPWLTWIISSWKRSKAMLKTSYISLFYLILWTPRRLTLYGLWGERHICWLNSSLNQSVLIKFSSLIFNKHILPFI